MKTFLLVEVDHDENDNVNDFTEAILDLVDFSEIPVHVRSITLAPVTS